jgi:GT2 family glycosyltransferase
LPAIDTAIEQDYSHCGYRLGVLNAAAKPNKSASVSVVIVTHNNRDLIGDCLTATFGAVRDSAAEVIVVDNASTDGTPDVIRAGQWHVDVIALRTNMGFAEAVNRARSSAAGRYLVLVNSDAFPDGGCIDALVNMLDNGPRVGIVGARLRYPSGRPQPSAGTFPSLLGTLWVALFLHRVPGLSRLGIGYLADSRLYRSPRRVDWVSAAVCAARIEIGPMPTSSFMYGEDVEWALASREAGYEVWIEPAATAVHIGRASVDDSQDVGFAQRRRAEFELAWFRRRGGPAPLVARVNLVVHGVMRLLIYAVLSLLHRRRDTRMREYAALVRASLSDRVFKR